MNLSRRAMLGATLYVSMAVHAIAQGYPTKPIRVVVPFPPGGGTDVIAREITQAVAQSTGWTFVVENRPGAGGNLGVDAVAKSPSDGYTLVLGQTSNLAINPSLYAKMPYDVAKDLAPVLLVAEAPLAMVTSTASSFKNVADAIRAAKDKPGAINYASPGNGTVAHLATELFQRTAGIKLQHVPYKGAAQAMTDVISGNVEIYMSSIPTLLGQIRQGKLRALAVTSPQRAAELPDVPTLAEAGFKGSEAVTWFGFAAPAGTPAPVIATLNQAFNKALKQPALTKKLADEGASVLGGTPDQFAALIRQDHARWAKVIQAASVRID